MGKSSINIIFSKPSNAWSFTLRYNFKMNRRKQDSLFEDLNQVLTMLDTLECDKKQSKTTLERIRKKLKKYAKDQTVKSEGGFRKRTKISQEFKDFLDLKDDNVELSRDEGTTAINVYIFRDPTKTTEKYTRWGYLNKNERNLRDGKIIKPDAKLAELINLPEYEDRVKKGLETRRMAVNMYNKAIKKGEQIEVVKHVGEGTKNEYYVIKIQEPVIFDWVIQKRITRHFLSNTTQN